MGAGKSTIGALLAEITGYRFYDTDKMLIKGFGGKSVSKIFAENGEEAFRKAENQVIAEFCKRQNVIVSTGGGTLIREETMGPALASGTVVYLRAPVEMLYERVIFSPKDRPILNEPETEEVFRAKFIIREAFYTRAHLTVDTHERIRREVAEEIVNKLNLPRKQATDPVAP